TVAANGVFLVGLLASGGETNVIVNVWVSLATQWIPVAILWLGDTYYTFAMDADGYLRLPVARGRRVPPLLSAARRGAVRARAPRAPRRRPARPARDRGRDGRRLGRARGRARPGHPGRGRGFRRARRRDRGRPPDLRPSAARGAPGHREGVGRHRRPPV